MSKKSEIGHFARIPLHVARADISETAKGLWRELAFLSSPRVPTVWVCQRVFAEKLNKCVKTVQRALKELLDAGLIKFAGWLHGRYKKYKLAWKKFFSQDAQDCPTTPQVKVEHPKTTVPEDANSFSEQLAEKVQKWQERFKCLDGKNGRPTLAECIDQGLAHKSRHNYDTPWAFLESWLRNAAGRCMLQYQQELATVPNRVESMREWEERRAKIQEEEFARHWPLIQERDRKREEERRIELGLGRAPCDALEFAAVAVTLS